MDDLTLLLGLLGIAAALGLALYAALAQIDERSQVRASLRQLGGYEIESVRDQELLQPLRERAILPTMRQFTDLGRRLTPVGYLDSVRHKLVLAGRGGEAELDRFLAIRVLTIVAAPVVMGVLFFLVGFRQFPALLVVLLAGLVFVLGPDALLNRRVEARQHEIAVKLPDMLDLLTISVEAGLGFEQALDRTIVAVPGALAEEFGRMLGEVRAGATRADALRGIDDRTDVPEVRSFVLALLQADTFGVSIGRVLRSQADEMRVRRRQVAQETAQKAPVKMLIPMVFCIFPALFVVVVGPAAINIAENFL